MQSLPKIPGQQDHNNPFEGGQSAPNPSTRAALQRAFEAAGVKIEPSGGVTPPEEQQEGAAA
jgi:hypothetical protein